MVLKIWNVTSLWVCINLSTARKKPRLGLSPQQRLFLTFWAYKVILVLLIYFLMVRERYNTSFHNLAHFPCYPVCPPTSLIITNVLSTLVTMELWEEKHPITNALGSGSKFSWAMTVSLTFFLRKSHKLQSGFSALRICCEDWGDGLSG